MLKMPPEMRLSLETAEKMMPTAVVNETGKEIS